MHTVLIVEDDPAVRRVIRLMLEKKSGYRVLDTEPAQAADLAQSYPEPIDLLVTDVIMPRFSCERVVASVLRHWPALKVLYISGYTEEITQPHGVAQGAANFLRKPFTAERLARKVEAMLERPSADEVAETTLKTVAALGPA